MSTIHPIPRYRNGVALTLEGGTAYVVTDWTHPHGADVVGYPSYGDAYTAFNECAELVAGA